MKNWTGLAALATMVVAVGSLAACSPSEGPSADKAASSGSVSSTPTETVVQTPTPRTFPEAEAGIARAAAVGPESFLRAVYAQYDSDVPQEAFGFPDAQWSARTRGLWAELAVEEAREGGSIYEAPLCEGNDCSAFAVTDISVTYSSPDRASALLNATQDGNDIVHQVIQLVREEGLWRIDDVRFTPTPDAPTQDLVAGLTQTLTEIESERAAG